MIKACLHQQGVRPNYRCRFSVFVIIRYPFTEMLFCNAGSTIQRMIEQGMKNDGVEVGQYAPLWVKDEDVTMCMLCASRFGMVHRKHHCRGCGRVSTVFTNHFHIDNVELFRIPAISFCLIKP